MEHLFSRVPTADIPRSSFNRTHGHKTTFDAAYLIPFFVDEVLPGDTFAVNASIFARLSTPIVPIMDNLHMDTFWFFVPNRLVWDNWQRFMGEQPNGPSDSTDFTIPIIVSGSAGWSRGSLFDYMGLPVEVADISCSALPFRAYNLIYNEWFRDQNLQVAEAVNKGDGPDSESDYKVARRGKRHDYFTSCLPWPQKGPGVELPLGSTAPIAPAQNNAGPTFKYSSGAEASALYANEDRNTDGTRVVGIGDIDTAGALAWSYTGLVADLSQATAATINSLRQAFQIQKLLERDARGGTRYTELLRSHFGVVSPDARLQRPEYLGGNSVPVIINPVVQTSGSPADTGYTDTPQGNLAAYGTAAGRGSGFHKSFVEHGYIIGLVMVRADLNYQYGMHRMWNRRTRYDFYWPAFAHLGEQAVLNKEIFCVAGSSIDPGTGGPANDVPFGYQERWAEYRYFPNKITGKFRSNDPQSLDKWHLAQSFTQTPLLNDIFISDASDVVVDRVIAVPSEPQFLFDSHIKVNCVRPMPTYSVPGYIDHF